MPSIGPHVVVARCPSWHPLRDELRCLARRPLEPELRICYAGADLGEVNVGLVFYVEHC